MVAAQRRYGYVTEMLTQHQRHAESAFCKMHVVVAANSLRLAIAVYMHVELFTLLCKHWSNWRKLVLCTISCMQLLEIPTETEYIHNLVAKVLYFTCSSLHNLPYGNP